MNEEFPCRTKINSGTNYHVAVWTKGNETMSGSPSGLTSFDTEEEAQRYIDSLGDLIGKYTITPNNWTEEVCIECGKEIW